MDLPSGEMERFVEVEFKSPALGVLNWECLGDTELETVYLLNDTVATSTLLGSLCASSYLRRFSQCLFVAVVQELINWPQITGLIKGEAGI